MRTKWKFLVSLIIVGVATAPLLPVWAVEGRGREVKLRGERAIVRAYDAQAHDTSGYSVSISGDTIVVGAYDEDGGADDPLERVRAATVPAPLDLSVSLVGGPDPFCPGSNPSYTFSLTNTLSIPLSNVVITSTLPGDTCCAVDAQESTVSGVFDAGNNAMVWVVGDVEVGQVVRAGMSLHTFTNFVPGQILTNTFTYMSDQHTEPDEVAVGLVADDTVCEPTPTPTSTPTNTPTNTPTATPTATPTTTPTPSPTPPGRILLPLVMC